ncbi:MAG TPA: hypothetical protein VFK88_05630 [Gallionella sp.]|nr:hypothetical protein [Gallionella sp.]
MLDQHFPLHRCIALRLEQIVPGLDLLVPEPENTGPEKQEGQPRGCYPDFQLLERSKQLFVIDLAHKEPRAAGNLTHFRHNRHTAIVNCPDGTAFTPQCHGGRKIRRVGREM